MKISDNTRKELVKEIDFVIKKMTQTPDPAGKLYFFSGIYSAFQRIFNSEFDPELVLGHIILNVTYNNINTIIERGLETVVKIPDDFFDKLVDITKKLSKKVKKNESIYDVLEQFAVLSYLATGNGYYLYQKGLLQV